jgi:hypothetical protein
MTDDAIRVLEAQHLRLGIELNDLRADDDPRVTAIEKRMVGIESELSKLYDIAGTPWQERIA